MMHGWGFGGGGLPMRFEEQYHCHSVAFADKQHLEKGDKILLPPSAFDTLARLQVDYPMLFRLTSSDKGTMTHSGVLEFTAEEGFCYIPSWMMQNLLLEEGAVITVENVSLPKATFVKLKPQEVDFLEISNPRAVLEHALRNFSCVTKGDVICVPYNDKNYHLQLMQVQPQDAACIIETDCNVDFDAPVGYKEPERSFSKASSGIGSSTHSLPPKQTAYADQQSRSSCPSPAASSTSAMSNGNANTTTTTTNNDDTDAGIRIVDGKIIRPDDNDGKAQPKTEFLATRTGATGVQSNAAIPVQAPTVDYWAVAAGDGARLDGKVPSALRDVHGTELDVAQLRTVAAAPPEPAPAIPASKRKTRTGGKFSKLKSKSAAFHGSGHGF